MRKRPPVTNAHHDADLTWWINSRDDNYLLPRRHDQVAGLLEGPGEPMHGGKCCFHHALHRRLFHTHPEETVRQRVSQVSLCASDVATLFEHLEHSEDLAARAAHTFGDRIDAHGRCRWRQE